MINFVVKTKQLKTNQLLKEYILMINVVKFHENSSKNEEVMAHFTGCTCYDVTPGTIYNKNICIFQSNTKRRVIFNVTHLA